MLSNCNEVTELIKATLFFVQCNLTSFSSPFFYSHALSFVEFIGGCLT